MSAARVVAVAGCLAVLLGLPGCIPYPTIERTPDPLYFALRRSMPIAGMSAYKELSDPKNPLYNPRHAADDLASALEWRGMSDALKPPPEQSQYWQDRNLQRGRDWWLNANTPEQRCLRLVQAGHARNSADQQRSAQCKTLAPDIQQQLLAQGLNWRAIWAFEPDAALTCAAELMLSNTHPGSLPTLPAQYRNDSQGPCHKARSTPEALRAWQQKISPNWPAAPAPGSTTP